MKPMPFEIAKEFGIPTYVAADRRAGCCLADINRNSADTDAGRRHGSGARPLHRTGPAPPVVPD